MKILAICFSVDRSGFQKNLTGRAGLEICRVSETGNELGRVSLLFEKYEVHTMNYYTKNKQLTVPY